MSHHHNIATDNQEALQATNDDAFESKLACLHAGYFTDPYLLTLNFHSRLPKPTRPPVINRGTFARVALKRSLLYAFASLPKCQIISLGAGFDTTAFNMHVHRFVELDLPEVVAKKGKLARGVYESVFDHVTITEDHVTAVQNSEHGVRHYELRACDALDLTALSATLSSAGVDKSLPTLILAEIMLVYLQPGDGDKVIDFFSNYFTSTRAMVVLEHTNPSDAFGETMARNIAARDCPLLGLHTYPTPESLMQRFKTAGFTDVRAETMLETFRKRFSPEQERNLQKVQLLDEVEEFELLLRHYVVLVAVAGEDAKGVLHIMELSRFQGTPFR